MKKLTFVVVMVAAAALAIGACGGKKQNAQNAGSASGSAMGSDMGSGGGSDMGSGGMGSGSGGM